MEEIIGKDFQGWSIYKRNWKYILEQIGFKFANIKDHYLELSYEGNVNELLKTYPEIYEDDGMGYSPITRYITEIENPKRIWINVKQIN